MALAPRPDDGNVDVLLLTMTASICDQSVMRCAALELEVVRLSRLALPPEADDDDADDDEDDALDVDVGAADNVDVTESAESGVK